VGVVRGKRGQRREEIGCGGESQILGVIPKCYDSCVGRRRGTCTRLDRSSGKKYRRRKRQSSKGNKRADEKGYPAIRVRCARLRRKDGCRRGEESIAVTTLVFLRIYVKQIKEKGGVGGKRKKVTEGKLRGKGKADRPEPPLWRGRFVFLGIGRKKKGKTRRGVCGTTRGETVNSGGEGSL